MIAENETGKAAHCGICSDSAYEALCDLFRTNQVSRALVFGSFARGEQSRRSDIDLLLVQETSARFFNRYDTLYERISSLLQPYSVDLLIYTEKELAILSSRKFIQSVLKEGKVIYESETATS
ncbi:MAG: nucleotidyltransferase domain-containing protein [Spartobacteria bacterium]|nr:nucleotidyltransferase domain-containing protein [Spartobacteria bacterium]